jgi:hypothetical protein
VAHQLSLTFAAPAPDLIIEDLDAVLARQLAVTQLAVVAVRQTGCVLSLISTGYELEAMAHSRTLLEAQYRARARPATTSRERLPA